MSAAPEDGTFVNGRQVAGVTLSRYSPVVGGTHVPAMKFS